MAAIRETWSSRTAFILAAIGSAIGLGNIWRFPYVTYENGGGAFLLAYFICLFLAGIPLLLLEFAIGHQYQQAAPGAFKGVHRRLQWFGWFAVGVGFCIVTYYAIVMSWCVNYTYHAATLGWEQPLEEVDSSLAVADTTLEDFQVQKEVPPELVGQAYRTPAHKGEEDRTDDVVVAEATSLVQHQGKIYAFPTRAEAEQFLQDPRPTEDHALDTRPPGDTRLLDRIPDDLVGQEYTSPLSGAEDRVRKVHTILVAYQGKLFAFNSVKEASSFMGSPDAFFFEDVLGATGDQEHPWTLGEFKWPLFAGLVISWIWIVLSVWKGTKTVGKVVYFTVLIPWAILVIFVIRGLMLEGASTGLRFYLTPVWVKLQEPGLWRAAISQVFFSLSVGFAIMIAYGSFLPKKTNLAGNAFIVGIADALTAFVGGLAVFSALGYQAERMGVPVSEVVQSGPGLAFVAYPHIISGLPYAQLFGILFFLMLLTLAVDSAFSLLEAATAAVRDKWDVSHRKANLVVGGVSFLLGIPMCFGIGVHILDIVDFFMNNYGLTIVVLLETVFIGWWYGARKQRRYINENSGFRVGVWWDICICLIVPLGILWMLVETIRKRDGPYGDFKDAGQEFALGWLLLILLPIIGLTLAGIRGRAEQPPPTSEDGP